jgi:hypothetical protein
MIACAAMAGGVAACAKLAGIDQFEIDPTPDAPDEASGPTIDARPLEASDDQPDSTLPSEASNGEGTDGSSADDGSDAAESEDTGSVLGDAANESSSGDANGASGPDAGDAGDGGCAAAVQHTNGVGGIYFDCAPDGTYGPSEAQAACASSSMGTCAAQMIVCGVADTETLECASTSNTCVCWTYQPPDTGHVRLSALGAFCQCPTGTDPAWN